MCPFEMKLIISPSCRMDMIFFYLLTSLTLYSELFMNWKKYNFDHTPPLRLRSSRLEGNAKVEDNIKYSFPPRYVHKFIVFLSIIFETTFFQKGYLNSIFLYLITNSFHSSNNTMWYLCKNFNRYYRISNIQKGISPYCF